MDTFYFCCELEASAKVRLLCDSIRYYEVISATNDNSTTNLMQCQSIAARALDFANWSDLVDAFQSPYEVRYVDCTPNPENELTKLLMKLRNAIGVEVDETKLRLAVTTVGFGFSPNWEHQSLWVIKPFLDAGLTRTQSSELFHLDCGWARATRYAETPELYSEIRHFYEVKKAKILGQPKPRKQKYRQGE